MVKLSAVVITYNEEANIRRCLDSLAFADEIVLVDAGSTDRSVEIASKYTDRIFKRKWEGYSSQKNFAIDQARGEWIFWLDADEEVSTQLAVEITNVVSSTGARDGYSAPRCCFFLGKWLRHGSWYPDRGIRLFKKDNARFRERAVHESLQVAGVVGELKGDILHYSYPNLEEFMRKLNLYTSLDADQKEKEGKQTGMLDIALAPWLVFFKSYVFKAGFLDGPPGFAAAALSSVYVLVKKLKLLERRACNAGEKRGSS